MENYDNFEELQGQNLKIMDLQIDIAVQFEYLRLLEKSKRVPASADDVQRIQELLYAPDSSVLNRKKWLIMLTKVDEVSVLRFLEEYALRAPAELRPFAELAAFHSKLHIESSLMGESQTVVASAMGGEGNRLRFFAALIPIETKPLNDTQKNLIRKEFNYIFPDFGASVENEINFGGKYPKFTMLVPYQIHPGQVVSEGIKLCNEIGKFLRDGAIISNVKRMTDREIDKMWRNAKQHVAAEDVQYGDDDDDD